MRDNRIPTSAFVVQAKGKGLQELAIFYFCEQTWNQSLSCSRFLICDFSYNWRLGLPVRCGAYVASLLNMALSHWFELPHRKKDASHQESTKRVVLHFTSLRYNQTRLETAINVLISYCTGASPRDLIDPCRNIYRYLFCTFHVAKTIVQEHLIFENVESLRFRSWSSQYDLLWINVPFRFQIRRYQDITLQWPRHVGQSQHSGWILLLLYLLV